MAKMQAAGVTAALGFALLLLGPVEGVAKSGGGWGTGPSHSFHYSPSKRPLARHRGAFRARHHGALGAWPLFGGYLAYPPYSYDGFDTVGEAPLVKFVFPPEPPRVLSCQRSRETVTVASQDGTTREINITRC